MTHMRPLAKLHREADPKVSEQCGGARARGSEVFSMHASVCVLMLWRATAELGEGCERGTQACRCPTVCPPYVRIGYRGEKARKKRIAAAEASEMRGNVAQGHSLALIAQSRHGSVTECKSISAPRADAERAE